MSWVDPLTTALLRASLEGAAAVGIVWLLCTALPRLPAALRCFLWWAACLRFLVALPGWSVATLPLLPAQWSTAPAIVAELADTLAAGGSNLRSAPPVGTTAIEAATALPVPRPAPGDARRGSAEVAASGPARADGAAALRPWFAAFWLVGLVAGALGLGRALLRLRRLLAGARPVTDRRLTTSFAALCRRLALRPPALLASSAIASPLVVGPARPRVLLPASGLTEMATEEAEMVLCHELAHLRRRDLWLGWLPALARTIFFFHPLAALAAREYALAREAACDAEVLRVLGSAPRDYGRLLLRWGMAPRESGLAAAAASPSRHHLKRRLLMLEDHSRSPRRRALLWTAPLVAAVLALLPLGLVASEGEAAILDPALLAALPPLAASGDEPPAAAAEGDSARPAPRVAAATSPSAATAASPAPAARPRPTGLPIPAAPPAPPPTRSGSLAGKAAPAAPPAPPGVATVPAVAPVPATPAVPAVDGIAVTPAPAPAWPAAAGSPTPAPAPTPPPPPAAAAVPWGATTGATSSYELRVSTSPAAAPRGAGAGAVRTPGAARTTIHSSGSSDRGAWVYLEGGDRTSMSGDSGDAEAAQRARRGDETLLYVRQGDSAWVVRDAALLAEAKSILAPVLELGRQQGELGRQQGELGREQGDLGRQQGGLGREQGELGREQGRLGAELGRLAAQHAELAAGARQAGDEERAALTARRSELAKRIDEIEERMHALGEQQRRLGERQRPLGDEQRELGERQSELGERQRQLGERQREASRRAEEELAALVARARAAGKAEAVR